MARAIIGKNESQVREKIKKWVPRKPTVGATGVTTLEDGLKRFVIGMPDQCAETFGKIFANGLDFIVVNFPDSHDLETIKLFGEGVLSKSH